jgi:AcrR family transcriptional regulator
MSVERNVMAVKGKRSYDSSRRREQAARTREDVLEAARAEFLGRGYAATTVARVASGAGVSVETVYKAFGGKAGLVRALWEQGLAGRRAVPAPERSDQLSSTATDPVAVVKGWGRFVAELAPEGAPIMLLIRSAAASDPEMAALWDEAEQQRRDRMRHNARRLRDRGWLRAGVTVAAATDVLWTYSSSELYDLLVVRSGWSARRFGDFVGDAMVAALL